MANIRELLGDELFAKVAEALKGKGEGGKDVALVVGNDGSYIPKEKFDQQNEKLRAAEKLAQDTQTALDSLKAAGDPAALAAALATAQQEAATQKKAYEAKMSEMELDFAIRAGIEGAQDAAIVAGLLDKSKLKLKDGQVEGLGEQVKALKESKPFLFAPKDEGKGLTGLRPAEGGKGGGESAELSQIMQLMGLPV